MNEGQVGKGSMYRHEGRRSEEGKAISQPMKTTQLKQRIERRHLCLIYVCNY
jgi:hypothetical protein